MKGGQKYERPIEGFIEMGIPLEGFIEKRGREVNIE
jgi:hypothetical protein